MLIRYFAAAAAAASVPEETVPRAAIEDDGATLGALLAHLGGAHPGPAPGPGEPARDRAGHGSGPAARSAVDAAGAGQGALRTASAPPSLSRVLSRSSFLVNGTSERSLDRVLAESDVVDVLPPFAGG
ncbi:MoaD/ThiS family protein [Zafaria sp. Z1313]|uniref:MoaD/ThiS family protein n=1 Tax=unclassified Zafaria TaxID=2828765 RepID=UPI002E78BB97|nr:MoaD/ThiS family protein [Zafaria sp. J156]MEE1621950.1 MoaD/ThiS family protein [Zafaria sp. J156]